LLTPRSDDTDRFDRRAWCRWGDRTAGEGLERAGELRSGDRRGDLRRGDHRGEL